MTSINDTVNYVCDNPDDRTAALALADRLQDESDRTRFTALRLVAFWRGTLRREADRYRMLSELFTDSKGLGERLYKIAMIGGAPDNEAVWIQLVRGNDRPKLRRVPVNMYGDEREQNVVRVGASWCVRKLHRIDEPANAGRPIVYGYLSEDEMEAIDLVIHPV